jgi:hypothetical protein
MFFLFYVTSLFQVYVFQFAPCQVMNIGMPYEYDSITLIMILQHASWRTTAWIIVLKRNNTWTKYINRLQVNQRF